MLFAQTNVVQWVSLAKDVSGSLQSVATVLALLIGGIWTYRRFIKKREDSPKASTSQTVSFWRIPGGNRLVRVSLTIKNEGDVLLKVESGFTWIQQMKPWPEEILKQQCEGLEIQWPLICEREIKETERFEIEPREAEVVQMDFIINEVFSQILVYSHIKNSAKSGKIGWLTSTVVDFDFEEQNKTHTIMSNEKISPGKRQGEAKPRPQPTQQPVRRSGEQGPVREKVMPMKKGN